MNHTPGPWDLEAIKSMLRFIHNTSNPVIEEMPDSTRFPDYFGNDAKLIAKAPEMFDVLEYIANAELTGNHASIIARNMIEKIEVKNEY